MRIYATSYGATGTQSKMDGVSMIPQMLRRVIHCVTEPASKVLITVNATVRQWAKTKRNAYKYTELRKDYWRRIVLQNKSLKSCQEILYTYNRV